MNSYEKNKLSHGSDFKGLETHIGTRHWMVIKNAVTSWLVQRTQRSAEHSVCPLEVDSLVVVVAVKGVRIVEVMGCPPASRLLHVEHDYSVPPHIHHVHKPAIAFSVPDINDQVCVQRALQNLIWWELVAQHLLVACQIEGNDLRRAELLQICQSVDDPGIDDKKTSAFVDRHAINRKQSAAIRVGCWGVRRPVWIWLKCWALTECWKLNY